MQSAITDARQTPSFTRDALAYQIVTHQGGLHGSTAKAQAAAEATCLAKASDVPLTVIHLATMLQAYRTLDSEHSVARRLQPDIEDPNRYAFALYGRAAGNADWFLNLFDRRIREADSTVMRLLGSSRGSLAPALDVLDDFRTRWKDKYLEGGGRADVAEVNKDARSFLDGIRREQGVITGRNIQFYFDAVLANLEAAELVGSQARLTALAMCDLGTLRLPLMGSGAALQQSQGDPHDWGRVGFDHENPFEARVVDGRVIVVPRARALAAIAEHAVVSGDCPAPHFYLPRLEDRAVLMLIGMHVDRAERVVHDITPRDARGFRRNPMLEMLRAERRVAPGDVQHLLALFDAERTLARDHHIRVPGLRPELFIETRPPSRLPRGMGGDLPLERWTSGSSWITRGPADVPSPEGWPADPETGQLYGLEIPVPSEMVGVDSMGSRSRLPERDKQRLHSSIIDLQRWPRLDYSVRLRSPLTQEPGDLSSFPEALEPGVTPEEALGVRSLESENLNALPRAAVGWRQTFT
jgi:hypothetical protein